MQKGIVVWLILFCAFWNQSAAQNHLVTRGFIYQKVQEGYFQQKAGTTIPQDNKCITKQEAKTWLNLVESYLPADDRLPWWSELVPVPAPVQYTLMLVNNTYYSTIWSAWGADEPMGTALYPGNTCLLPVSGYINEITMDVSISEPCFADVYINNVLVRTETVPVDVGLFTVPVGYGDANMIIEFRR